MGEEVAVGTHLEEPMAIERVRATIGEHLYIAFLVM